MQQQQQFYRKQNLEKKKKKKIIVFANSDPNDDVCLEMRFYLLQKLKTKPINPSVAIDTLQ